MADKLRTRPHTDLAALAAEQHGVVSTRQLLHLGYPRSTIADAARAGRLHRLHRGVYAVGHTDLDDHAHVMAAALAAAPAVASHWTAAWLWGLVRANSTIHLTAPGRRHRREGFVVHHAKLAPQDTTELAGIPATSLARTVLDLVPQIDDARLASLLRDAVALTDEDTGRRLFDRREFEELLARCRHHPGTRRLQKALSLYDDDPSFTRSDFEREFRERVRRAGLPLPAANFVVAGHEIDAYWEEERFGVELDVFSTHGSRLSFERDRERAEELLAHGIEIVRITDVRLRREPEEVMRRLAAHLERRRRTGAFN